jgi:hypothetical protein
VRAHGSEKEGGQEEEEVARRDGRGARSPHRLDGEGGESLSGEEEGREEEEVAPGYGGEGVQPLPASAGSRREVMRTMAKKKAAKKKK